VWEQVGEFMGDNCHPLGSFVGMKTFTIRDFRSKPKQMREELVGAGESLLTANGKPVAVMLPVDAGNLEETLAYLRRARALQALGDIWDGVRKSGRDKITMEEIDLEIQAVRQERKLQAGSFLD
jgi:antitoxin (DNA-binding transcriptional repressor) of toxin-antitoxin stability system